MTAPRRVLTAPLRDGPFAKTRFTKERQFAQTRLFAPLGSPVRGARARCDGITMPFVMLADVTVTAILFQSPQCAMRSPCEHLERDSRS